MNSVEDTNGTYAQKPAHFVSEPKSLDHLASFEARSRRTAPSPAYIPTAWGHVSGCLKSLKPVRC